jgi:hypothetical protein
MTDTEGTQPTGEPASEEVERDEAFANDPSEEKAREAAEKQAEEGVTTPSADEAGGPIDTERWPAGEHHDPSEEDARIEAEKSVEAERGASEVEAEASVEAERGGESE